jgi:hypothetical protein
MDTIKRLKWFIAAFVAVVLVSAYAVIQTIQQPVTTAKESSAYVITKEEATKITNMVSRSIIACGTWGDSDKVNVSNASDFYDSARMYALNSSRLPEQYQGYAVSRHDKRQICISDYVSDNSVISNTDIDYSDRDAMMSYTVDNDSISISSPTAAKVSINSNANTSLTLNVSWTSKESGIYPIFKAVPYDNGGYEYDNSIDGNTQWKTFSVEHNMEDIKIDIEKTEDGWKINGISGGNWKKDGYVNVLSNTVSINDGANRVKTPWEENPTSFSK